MVHAARAAAEEGMIPGGGVALLRVAEAIDKLELLGDTLTGARIAGKALDTSWSRSPRTRAVKAALSWQACGAAAEAAQRP